MSRRSARRAGALTVSATLAASAVLLVAPVAHAEVVDVDYACKTPIGDKSAVSPIDIKAVASGDTYKLTMSFQKGVSSSPVELGKGAMRPSAVIKLGGADSGTVAVSGPANDAPIPANTPIKISDLSGTYTPKKGGQVTFTAGTLTILALGTTTTCNPSNNPKPSLTLDVKAPGGTTGGSTSGSTGGSTAGSTGGSTEGSTGGSTGGGTTTGGSTTGGGTTAGSTGGSATGGSSATGGGQLPQTGPSDSAIALGTLGGTVLLAGVAGTLWLTRRRRTAG
ncbi:LPXTG cell wall anchor domain-containing protein [Streptomyces triculaminicus]|uniref:LPXTG cell wall anchor domain-containing protein n=2 Tax=Streptomyces TaxID=1883 RepID=A0A939FKJ6_9ACTN|nr:MULTISPECIES: LPXTG cell wall anchor domain-containing protein [Streptomyces]MBO0651727.1 LPXTG cell wall anchor domain-containing protein [Streptomyces triculaminicus]QSY47336.1 LPXTG cell wall anchor domain-containing protein [Streptomyces griseocarneus]